MKHIPTLGLPFIFLLLGGALFLQYSSRMKPSFAPSVEPLEEVTEISNEINLLSGQWDYMPGITKSDEGLIISSATTALVNQDGSFVSDNPAINLAGVHLENLSGDFSIKASVQLLQSSAATLQFYALPPIIADEFKIDRENIKATIENGKLAINGQAFAFDIADSINLVLARRGDDLEIVVNEKSLGKISIANIFASGQLWIGFDSTGGEWLLTSLVVEKINGGDFLVSDASGTTLQSHTELGLQALAQKQRNDFLVGTSVALGPLVSDADFAKVALDNQMFGSITPENAMKMINLQPYKGIYQFEYAEALVKLAKQNGQSIHGHTLVFGEANPPWFNALPVETAEQKQEVEKIMIDHITTVITHFGDEINSWDVVNEPLADTSRRRSGNILRTHKWYQAMGEDYIVKALIAAHKANPQALLFINEYGLEADGRRWENFISLIERILPQLEGKVPTKNLGVGFQAHVYEEGDEIDADELKDHIRQLQKLGIKAQISEMDVYESVQSEQYPKVLQTCISEPNCVAWRGWMLSDRYNIFKDDKGQTKFGRDGLFDDKMIARPALVRMLDSLK